MLRKATVQPVKSTSQAMMMNKPWQRVLLDRATLPVHSKSPTVVICASANVWAVISTTAGSITKRPLGKATRSRVARIVCVAYSAVLLETRLPFYSRNITLSLRTVMRQAGQWRRRGLTTSASSAPPASQESALWQRYSRPVKKILQGQRSWKQLLRDLLLRCDQRCWHRICISKVT